MSDIQFQEPQYTRSASYDKGPSGVVGLVLRFGLAKDEAGAQKILLIILGLCILVMGIVWVFSGGPPANISQPPTP
jgi:hypothetical protein